MLSTIKKSLKRIFRGPASSRDDGEPPSKIVRVLNEDEGSVSAFENRTSVVIYKAENFVENLGPVETQVNNFYDRPAPRSGSILFDFLDPIDSFRGRNDEIRELDENLSSSKFVVVCGTSGMGKTELARYYGAKRKENYCDNLIWIKAETRGHLETSFRQLLDYLGLPEKKGIQSVVNDVYAYFKDTRALFIFDNAPDRRTINTFLPTEIAHKNIPVKVLITTQYTDWKKIPTIRLQQLSPDDAVSVIEAIVEEENFRKEDRAEWMQLVKVFDFIPLGIQIAGAYIDQMMTSTPNDFSLLDYISKLKEQSHILEEELPAGSAHSYENTIYTALRFTLDKIGTKVERNKWALDIMNIYAYLDTDYITEQELQAVDAPEKSMDYCLQALYLLKKYALIINYEKTKNDVLRIRIHRLVQRFFRYDQERLHITYKYYKEAFSIALSTEKFSHCRSVLTYPKQLEEFFQATEPEKSVSLICENDLLHRAAIILQGDSMEVLLTHGASAKDVGRVKWKKSTPLQVVMNRTSSSLNGKKTDSVEKCFRLLLDRGAEGGSIDDSGRSILHYAAWLRSIPFIKFLIDNYQLDVNRLDNNGRSPLQLVIMLDITNKNLSLVKDCINFLVSHRTEPNKFRYEERTMLHIVSQKRYVDMITFLVDEHSLDVNAVDANEWTPLHWLIIQQNRTEEEITASKWCINALVDRGARLDIVDYRGWNVIQCAAEKRCVELMMYLIDYTKVDVNMRDRNERTLMQIATLNGEISEEETLRVRKCIDALIQRGADYTLRDDEGWTLLHFLAFTQLQIFIDLFKYMVERYKMEVNVRDNFGTTPLHLVARKKFDETDTAEKLKSNVYTVLSLGADLHAKDDEGWTLVHYATASQCPELIEYVIDELRMDPKVQDVNGCSPLHVVATQSPDNQEVIPRLKACIVEFVSRNIPIDIEDNEGWTILHYAAEIKCWELMEHLIDEFKMNPNSGDFKKRTALHIVVEQIIRDEDDLEKSTKCIKSLVARGAQVEVWDDDGLRPVDIAVKVKNQDLVPLLTEDFSKDNDLSQEENSESEMQLLN